MVTTLGWAFPVGWAFPPFSHKESVCNAGGAGDTASIPGSGKSTRGGNGNPFQDSCWEDHMDRGAWWVTVHRVTKSWTLVYVLCIIDV